jgi:hypothetical protein
VKCHDFFFVFFGRGTFPSLFGTTKIHDKFGTMATKGGTPVGQTSLTKGLLPIELK